MGIRVGKTGMALEIAAMQDVARTLSKLPLEMRQRVANWVSAQPWEDAVSNAGTPDPRQEPLFDDEKAAE
jgi:hypothetical protein